MGLQTAETGMEWAVVLFSIALGAGTYGLYWLVDRLRGRP